MLTLTAYLPALALYIAASFYLLLLIKKGLPLRNNTLLLLTAGAVIAHGIGLASLMHKENHFDLGIHHMLSLVSICVNTVVLISSIKKSLQNLFIFLFPIAILTIIASALMSHNQPLYIQSSPGVIGHIVTSILSYSLLAVAVLQALIWSWQNHQIKQHRMTRITRLLPPLQTMEHLMFELVLAGVIFLSLAILLGFIYLNNIFAQHLVHKTVLSIFAWLVFVGLLVGRYQAGWRGNTAVKWIFTGFLLLMLAYFGSKLVLELILA